MDLKLIHTFVIAAKENNLTKAAQILGYAQSTITAQIKLLEDELDMTLFDRLGKSIYLSANGKAFVPYARQLLDLEQEIKNTFCCLPDLVPLTVGVSQSLANTLLPSIAGQFQTLYPQTPLNIRLQTSAQLRDLLRTNEIDVAICMKHDSIHEDLLSYETKKEAIHFFASALHPAKETTSLTLETLCTYPFALTAKGCYYHEKLLSFLSGQNLSCPICLESDNVNLLKQFAIKGLGILFLPDIAVQDEIDSGRLIKLKPGNLPEFSSESEILIHRHKVINISLQRFLAIAEEFY